MPTYSYRHPKNGELTEVVRPMSESKDPYVFNDGAVGLRVYDIGGVSFAKGRDQFHNGPTYREELTAARNHPEVLSGESIIRDGIRHV